MPRQATRLPPKLLWMGVLTPILFGFDFATKQAARTLGPTDAVPLVDPWLSLVHAENPGAMFSMPVPMPLLIAAGFVILAVLVQTYRALPDAARLPAVALALVTAGGLGNQIDRIDNGTVTDMVRLSAVGTPLEAWFHTRFGLATWPIFNVADVWLLVGVAMLLVLPKRWMQRAEPPAPA